MYIFLYTACTNATQMTQMHVLQYTFHTTQYSINAAGYFGNHVPYFTAANAPECDREILHSIRVLFARLFIRRITPQPTAIRYTATMYAFSCCPRPQNQRPRAHFKIFTQFLEKRAHKRATPSISKPTVVNNCVRLIFEAEPMLCATSNE